MKLAFALILGALGCGAEPVQTPATTTPAQAPAANAASPMSASRTGAQATPGAAAELDPRFVDGIRRAGPAHAAWGRVDESPRAAPTDCDMPSGDPDGKASQVRLSQAVDAPHGAKLYYLWASDRAGYLAHRPAAVGFTIVKESFHADSDSAAPANAPPPSADYFRAPPPIRTLEIAGRRLHTGAPTGLYVMTKIGATDAPGSDAGWIYGTIEPDGTVTSAGRVASCIGCHEDAPHERLFGLKPDRGA